MKLSFCSDSLGFLSYTQMLDKLLSMQIYHVELATGGWSSAPHIQRQELLANRSKLKQFKAELDAREMTIAALNCSGNPLWPGALGKEHDMVTEETFQLAEALEVNKVVMMSGLPGATPSDGIPNWICYTTSWPAVLRECLDYQWNDIAIPFWHNKVALAKKHGIEKIALENFSAQLVYNCDTLFKLRDAVDPIIGLNLDPSHLMWMGADPIACARELGDAIHHVHAKDARLEKGKVDINGVLETLEVEKTSERAWNYVAVGCGKDLQWWKEFFAVVRMMGYNDAVSLEMEDLTMTPLSGVHTSVEALQKCIVE